MNEEQEVYVSDYGHETDDIWIWTNQAHHPEDETTELQDENGHVLSWDPHTLAPKNLEILLSYSAYVPLCPEKGYDPVTDTQTFGWSKKPTDRTSSYGQLTVDWEKDEDGDFNPLRVKLGNAKELLGKVAEEAEAAVTAAREEREKVPA